MAIIRAHREKEKNDTERCDKTAREERQWDRYETRMVNKKDFAMRKIYFSYCYKRDREGREEKDISEQRNVWMLLPSLFDLEDVHCASRSCAGNAGIFILKLGRLAMRLAMRFTVTKLL